MLKRIRIPKNKSITISLPTGAKVERPFGWKDVAENLSDDPRFLQASENVFKAYALREKLLEGKPGGHLDLEVAEYELVRQLSSVAPNFRNEVAWQIPDFLLAIKDAESIEEPEKPAGADVSTKAPKKAKA